MTIKAMVPGFALMAAALLFAPPAAQAQAPVTLVCHDGTTQPGPSKVACKDHGGMDWNTTKSWSQMKAGHYSSIDKVVCIDGQNAPAAKNSCESNGGVDSVATIAALKSRARAERYTESDSMETSGYRAMEHNDSTAPSAMTPSSDSSASDSSGAMGHQETAPDSAR